MAKLPAFQFYPGDWMKDPGVRRCSHAARGVWIDMLCLMFECGERGVLFSGGCPWSREDVAAAVGGNLDVTLRLIDELVAKGVCAVREDGSLFSKRMVRDELERADARERQKLKRERERSEAERVEREKESRACHAVVTPMSHPSSSSTSSSTSVSKKNTKKKFQKPSIQEVQAYCVQRKNLVDPQAFLDFYDSKGWMIGRNSMKDWEAAVRTWEKNERSSSGIDKPETRVRRGETDYDNAGEFKDLSASSTEGN